MFPIKYIEDNLVINQEGECIAYYELIPYNYSFLSREQKEQMREEFRQLAASSRDGKIHMVEIAVEAGIKRRQDNSKRWVTGRLRDVTKKLIDDQTQILLSDKEKGVRQIDYRFFMGYKLVVDEEEVSLKKMKERVGVTLSDFVRDVNHKLLGDFNSVSNTEMARYSRMEKKLFVKLGRRFRFKRLREKDFGFLIEHLYGQTLVPFYDYDYKLPKSRFEGKTLVKKYDLLRLTRCLAREHQRYVKLVRENEESYAAYLTIDRIVGELPVHSEVFYYQQESFSFPVDTSVNVEIVANKKALATVRGKKKELKDLDEHAWQNHADTENVVIDAMQSVEELEDELNVTKDAMYKLSYVVRVAADDLELLEQRIDEVKEFYDEKNIKLVRPFGDMAGLSGEFIPGSNRYENDYVQYVTADFLASLGFGASQILGEEDGIYFGENIKTGKHVYIRPNLAAQGVKGSVTNALAKAFLGSLGWGKSVLANLLAVLTVFWGGKVLIVDPKSERGGWKEKLPLLEDEINIVNLTSDEQNAGMLDPFVIMKRTKDAESLAMDVLTYLTGITIDNGEKFPELREAVRKVAKKEKRGLLHVIDELHEAGNPVAENIARHIQSFADYDFAQLIFSSGEVKRTIDLDKQLNIIQVQDLVLPGRDTKPAEYSSTERLSIAMLIVISTFALDFIYSDRSIFKDVVLDEAWSILGVAQGKELTKKLIRAGRSMNAAVDIVTQNADDVGDEKMKNNIGLKFAFHSTDLTEIKKILLFFGLDPEDEGNQFAIKNLDSGQCLFQDLYGHIGIIYVDPVFRWMLEAFDTKPPMEQEDGF